MLGLDRESKYTCCPQPCKAKNDHKKICPKLGSKELIRIEYAITRSVVCSRLHVRNFL